MLSTYNTRKAPIFIILTLGFAYLLDLAGTMKRGRESNRSVHSSPFPSPAEAPSTRIYYLGGGWSTVRTVGMRDHAWFHGSIPSQLYGVIQSKFMFSLSTLSHSLPSHSDNPLGRRLTTAVVHIMTVQ